MKSKISIICLGVSDLERSRLFYQALGLKTHNFDPAQGVVFFDMEGTWLELFPRSELAKDAGVTDIGDATTDFRGVTLAHNEPDKEGVNRVMAEAIAAGAKLIKQPEDVFWGGYSGYFADPDGHLWEVAYNPYTDLT
jgi:catechol 2,3-dioxygenase-like lactoylglutathione lyase family enzyme